MKSSFIAEAPMAVKPSLKVIGLMAFFILLSCWALFYTDHTIKGIADLFQLANLLTLPLYFIPTFIICTLLYRWLSQENGKAESMVLSLGAGIPLSFMFVISVLYFLMN